MAVVLRKNEPTKECECGKCRSLIGYLDNELLMGDDDNGASGLGIMCPVCGEFINVKPMESSKWPDAFYHFGVTKGAMQATDEEIQQWIDGCVERLRREGLDYTYTGSGDTIVIANWDGDNIVVRVAKNYYEAYI